MISFNGKTIWLVGASTGIGEALALSLARRGAVLAISARSADKLADLCKRLPGGPHLALPLDVTSLPSVQSVWSYLMETWGGVDTVIYNAGAYDPMSAIAFDLERTEAIVDVNFRGALRMLSCVIPAFVARKSGRIALVGSIAAYTGLPNAIGYGASKAALVHLAENLRLDLGGAGIKVQVFNPGFVKTRLTDKNTFPMPFLMSADAAAEQIMHGLQSERFEISFPKKLSFILKLIRLLPYALSFKILQKL